MIKFLSVLILLISSSYLVIGQQLSEKEMVGFGCGNSGRYTKPVEQSLKLLKEKNYAAIKKNLSSDNSAKQFLAVIVLIQLNKNGDVFLGYNEFSKIYAVMSSHKKVAYCSGCSMWDEPTLQEVLDEENGHPMLSEANYSIAELIAEGE